jgi:hypothetical protein
MRSRHVAAAVALATCLLAPAAAHAAPVPANADWSQAYITEADGTKLHADILRPAGLPATQPTPVILSIGPYFNHSGQTGPAGPVEGTTFDPTGPAGPSDRFLDFVEGAHRDATLISRNASLVARCGPVSLDLYGDDWVVSAGHRVGVLVTGANAEW